MFKLLPLYSDTTSFGTLCMNFPETSSPFVGHMRRLSFCVVKHQRSSRLTSGRPTAPSSTMESYILAIILLLYRSPCLNPVDYCIWGHVQHHVYQKPVKDVDQLKQRLIEVWSGLQQTVFDEAIDEWRRRLRACVRVKG